VVVDFQMLKIIPQQIYPLILLSAHWSFASVCEIGHVASMRLMIRLCGHRNDKNSCSKSFSHIDA
jgi:hypothetical protein